MTAQINFLDEMIVDNFAGGGGASTGIELATGRIVDIAINHDIDAILMHKTNHPFTEHLQASVWDVDPVEVCKGRKVGLAWFSPDCKHFSKAKGSKPVEKSIRGLAWIVLRWAGKVKPRVIILENVEEFKTWGPVRHGRPVKSKKGQTFEKWKSQLEGLGYQLEHRELVACDYGAPTTRKRFFVVARCDGRPIVWPKKTHGEGLLPYRSAAEIIDFSLPVQSIFGRKKPLAENTLKRIAKGLQKFVVDNPNPFIFNYKFNNEPEDINQPLSTITSVNSHYVAAPMLSQLGQTGVAAFITKYYGGCSRSTESDVKGPLHTITSVDHNRLAAVFLQKFYKTGVGQELRESLHTITTSPGHFAEVRTILEKIADQNEEILNTMDLKEQNLILDQIEKKLQVKAFLIKYYGQGIGQDINNPLDTVVGKDKFGLVMVKGEPYEIVDIAMRMLTPRELYNAQGFPADYIIDRDYTGKSYPKSKQVARCGNAVPPPFAEALVRANLPEWCSEKIGTMEQLMRKVAASD